MRLPFRMLAGSEDRDRTPRRRPRRRRPRARQLRLAQGPEALEARSVPTLLGIGPTLGFPLLFADVNGSFDLSSSRQISIAATPVSLQMESGQFPLLVGSPSGLTINVAVNATAPDAPLNVVDGPGNELTVSGSIDLDGDTVADVSGVLLTGSIVAAGFQNNPTASDSMDFRFVVTGGAPALTTLFVGQDIGVTVGIENSTLPDGVWPFGASAQAFQGRPTKIDLGPTGPLPSDLSCAGCIQNGDTAVIGFWASSRGQALIKGLDGGATATEAGAWLSTLFPNLFGDVAGMNNQQLADHFVALKSRPGDDLEAEILATALSVYVTDSDSGNGALARSYGFTVSADGTAAKRYNVGLHGPTLGLDIRASYTILAILRAADTANIGGALYGASSTVRASAVAIFGGLNRRGSI